MAIRLRDTRGRDRAVPPKVARQDDKARPASSRGARAITLKAAMAVATPEDVRARPAGSHLKPTASVKH